MEDARNWKPTVQYNLHGQLHRARASSPGFQESNKDVVTTLLLVEPLAPGWAPFMATDKIQIDVARP